jgi:hypothetical protein
MRVIRPIASSLRARARSLVVGRWSLVVSALAAIAFPAPAGAEPPPTPSETTLGTVEVTGSAAVALPKLGFVPLDENAAERAIVAKDLDTLGTFDVVTDAPAGPFGKDDPIDSRPGARRASPCSCA